MATERRIGTSVYRCEKLPASEGLKLFLRVSKLFRAAPDMIASIAAGDSTQAASASFLVLALSDDATGGDTHDLLVTLAQSCTVNGDPCIVGVKPAAIEDLIQVAWFAMEVNFRDFLAASLAER